MAAPLGPPPQSATTSILPSGVTRLSVPRLISTTSTLPSGMAIGPSGNSRPVAMVRTFSMPRIIGRMSEAVPLAHNAVVSSTAGLWRTERDGDPAILKVLHCGTEGLARWLASPDIDHPRYWRREALAYQSGLLDSLDGVRAARLLDVVERPDGSVELWLEDLAASGTPATEWSIDRLALAARHLGRMQGGGALAAHRWLSHGWLQEYVEGRADLMAGKLDVIEPALAAVW